MPFISFTSLYQSRVWGGRQLAATFGRHLPEGDIGESWEVVDRPEAQSVVATGKYQGLTLRQLAERHGRELLSADYDPTRPFPILVKWLDCRQRLSLQVHPPASRAAELKGEPKTECWYIAHAAAGAGVFAGLKAGVSRADFEAAIHANALEPLCQRLPTQAGDFLFVPSGRLHAIDAGNLILEIQQNSDTTYRVYDWGRPRQLHIAESLASIGWSDTQPEIIHTNSQSEQTLVCSPLFTVRRYRLTAGQTLQLPPLKSARLISIVEGGFEHEGTRHNAGENLLLPYSQTANILSSQQTTLIITTDFI
jgi:mannose-6-phosphate isomerase